MPFRVYDPLVPVAGAEPLLGPEGYLPADRVRNAVNAAYHAGQPLLVTGEPGVGKTVLAESVAWHLKRPLLMFAVKSDSRGRDALYRFEHLERMYDAFRNDERARTPANYLHFEALGTALQSKEPSVVLIDEVDKAPRDFPNDLLHELDRGAIQVPEVGGDPIPRQSRPLILLTSNEEKDLPEPFLRRCAFVRVPFPSAAEIEKIAQVRLGADAAHLIPAATARFLSLRGPDPERWRKRPSTSELLAWITVMIAAGVTAEEVAGPLENLPMEVLVKTRDDLKLCGLPSD